MHGRRAGKAGPGRRDGFHHDGGIGDAEARAAISLRDADTEPAVGGERAIKLVGEFAVTVALEPIIVAEARADFFNRGAQRLLKLGKGKVDRRYSTGQGDTSGNGLRKRCT
jgi:hypothetical protein